MGASAPGSNSKLPELLRREQDPYGFVGRDGALLELERALRCPPAGILIHGPDGVGKTALARGFLQWLDATGSLGDGCFWLDFQEIRSAEGLFNRLGEFLFGGQLSIAPLEQKLELLVQVLRQHRLILVWDHFESAAGIPGAAVAPHLPAEDRQLLADFLHRLQGGASKVLIASRSEENWLAHQECSLLPLGGLEGPERWEFVQAVRRALGLSANREDPALPELMEWLGGHPLALRALVPRLEQNSAGELIAALRANRADLDPSGDEAQARLYSALRLVEQSLPQELLPLLSPQQARTGPAGDPFSPQQARTGPAGDPLGLLAMHAGYADADYLEAMAQQIDKGWARSQIDRLMEALGAVGLLRGVGHAVFELHPLLTAYLHWSRARELQAEAGETWARAFTVVMAEVANRLAPLELHRQRGLFHIYGRNLHSALAQSERLSLSSQRAALTQSLAIFAQNSRSFAEASRLFQSLAEQGAKSHHARMEASACHQLGKMAQEQRDFAAAEKWYRQALAVDEKTGDEQAASTCHQLGVVAQEQRDLTAAGAWFRRALILWEKTGSEHATTTCGQLGELALQQGDFAAAQQWHRQALEIQVKAGDKHTAAGDIERLHPPIV